eukprot:Lankesteria_metandrocarpae@DN3798_c0_g1_i1.p1
MILCLFRLPSPQHPLNDTLTIYDMRNLKFAVVALVMGLISALAPGVHNGAESTPANWQVTSLNETEPNIESNKGSSFDIRSAVASHSRVTHNDDTLPNQVVRPKFDIRSAVASHSRVPHNDDTLPNQVVRPKFDIRSAVASHSRVPHNDDTLPNQVVRP